MAYITLEEYKANYSDIPDKDLNRALNKASRHIDSLTYGRIRGVGFDNLTPFQQEIIKEVNCELANFEYENAELIENVLSSYSINGVSMNFGDTWNVKLMKGVAIPTELYETLAQTGLTCRNVRW
ncbi:hypothetical protein SAMN02745248_02408 [Hathewaya proteolytica DSM 3090]|uniref:Uncharacterized protein n=1 Tax=Hathewaya proteolytica DSM 3090 TaxID=1121331 RepID=A0A1M6RZU3_9CLOT|nr:hypothetical protein [Hathewaya proteolytica]SHK38082.1 hypothetical protein SAMN02745248_02408 [Hathewaya proteolytica DSM 3090]